MFLSYVFLKKFKDADYYQIIDVVNLTVGQSQFMQLENYDLAFRIDKAAVKLYENAIKNGHIPLVDLKNKDTEVILPEDILIVDFDEIKKIRKEDIQRKKVEIKKEDFTDEDLYFEYIFEEEKKKILEKALGNWFPAINMIYIMYTIDLIEAQTILYSRGYMITEENKEDIFIEIIEKDEDDLIEILERYIEARDEIMPVFNAFKFYRKLKEELDEISYWDFDNYEEASKKSKEIAQKYTSYEFKMNPKSNKELFKKLYLEHKNKK